MCKITLTQHYNVYATTTILSRNQYSASVTETKIYKKVIMFFLFDTKTIVIMKFLCCEISAKIYLFQAFVYLHLCVHHLWNFKIAFNLYVYYFFLVKIKYFTSWNSLIVFHFLDKNISLALWNFWNTYMWYVISALVIYNISILYLHLPFSQQVEKLVKMKFNYTVRWRTSLWEVNLISTLMIK